MGGDISNGIPARVLVHWDIATVRVTETKRRLLVLKSETEVRYPNPITLSALWRYTDRHSLVLELIGYEESQKAMDAFLETLDATRAHPFRSATHYASIQDLVHNLPYRQDVLGVMDTPERGLWYGSRWIDYRNTLN